MNLEMILADNWEEENLILKEEGYKKKKKRKKRKRGLWGQAQSLLCWASCVVSGHTKPVSLIHK